MSGVLYTVATGERAMVRSPETVLQIWADLDRRLRVWQWTVAFKGGNPHASPVLVELLRPTGWIGDVTPAVPVHINSGDDEQTVSVGWWNLPTEPPGTTVIESHEVHPQHGIVWTASCFEPDALIIPGNGYLSFRVSGGVGLSALVRVLFED
ncbi:MAG: hypothetical protein V2A76_00945 [Planctomycetota bacterium]